MINQSTEKGEETMETKISPKTSKGYKFNFEQKEWFKAYEKVRLEGRYNMYGSQARMLTGLSKDEYRFVMNNYTELKKACE